MKISTTKLFMHTLCMTLFIIIFISFQATLSSSTKESPPKPWLGQKAATPPAAQPKEEEIQDYARGDSPPYIGGGNTGGPIPHPWQADEEEEREGEAIASEDIHLLF
ncbi:hypothetical protein L2E82_17169 [Cichorium intybus]|uniref:Uncharacterized protein n=1 Tax=Cichorium intybus TaxID=13427 RepID=A0ACB9F757_CICIN|nr:hypothetical protein L2E82_17169 [Cichorium intybus]